MKLRLPTGWQVVLTLMRVTLMIAVVGMLVRKRPPVIAGMVGLVGGASLASWMMNIL